MVGVTMTRTGEIALATAENEVVIPVTDFSDYSNRNDVTPHRWRAWHHDSGLLTLARTLIKGLTQFFIIMVLLQGRKTCRWTSSIKAVRSFYWGLSPHAVDEHSFRTLLGLLDSLWSRHNKARVTAILAVVYIPPFVSMLAPWWYFTYDEEADETGEERERRGQIESREEELEGM